MRGYTVVLCFVGLESAALSRERVALRVNEGGHDVPTSKLATRFARTLDNLVRAVVTLPYVLIFDNSVPTQPYRLVAEYQEGNLTRGGENPPEWFKALVLPKLSTSKSGDSLS